MSNDELHNGQMACAPVERRVSHDCYDESGAPIKCFKCGCEEINERVTDTLDVGVGRGITMEFECICARCDERVGYWAHGSYDPCFMMANALANVPARTGD